MTVTPPGQVASGPAAPECLSDIGCITCGDEGVEMRALKVDVTAGLAVCVDRQGSTSEVDLGIVGAVTPGDSLLVHAGVALARLERATGGVVSPERRERAPEGVA